MHYVRGVQWTIVPKASNVTRRGALRPEKEECEMIGSDEGRQIDSSDEQSPNAASSMTNSRLSHPNVTFDSFSQL
jgi:hypothetical protein